MTALAAGLGVAMAGSPDQADAQASSFVMTLSDGTAVELNTETIPFQTQGDIIDTLQGCIGGEEVSRDQCIVNAAVRIARERLDAVIVETKQELKPLEEGIGLTAAEIIQEPVFCEYAPDANTAQNCSEAVGHVQVAAAEYQLAEARERRVATQVRVANLDAAIATTEAARDAAKQQADASAAVLAALQRVTDAERIN